MSNKFQNGLSNFDFQDTRTFLICGGAGFIGSALAKRLIELNQKIIIIDNLKSGKLANLLPYEENNHYKFVNATIGKDNQIHQYFEECDFVVHFAAMVGVEVAIKAPTELLINNILASEFIIQQCLKYNKGLFVASSSEVYGKFEREELTETDFSYVGYPHLSRWAYSVAKLADEFMLYEYKRKGLKVIIGRFFNFIGENQNGNYGFVIPKFIKMAKSNQDFTVYGDGTQRRTYCDINDGINAIMSLIGDFDKLSNMEFVAFNIGGEQDISINDLANLIKSISKSNSQLKYISHKDLLEGFDEIKHRKANCKLIHEATGWHPTISLSDTLRRLIIE